MWITPGHTVKYYNICISDFKPYSHRPQATLDTLRLSNTNKDFLTFSLLLFSLLHFWFHLQQETKQFCMSQIKIYLQSQKLQSTERNLTLSKAISLFPFVFHMLVFNIEENISTVSNPTPLVINPNLHPLYMYINVFLLTLYNYNIITLI